MILEQCFLVCGGLLDISVLSFTPCQKGKKDIYECLVAIQVFYEIHGKCTRTPMHVSVSGFKKDVPN